MDDAVTRASVQEIIRHYIAENDPPEHLPLWVVLVAGAMIVAVTYWGCR